MSDTFFCEPPSGWSVCAPNLGELTLPSSRSDVPAGIAVRRWGFRVVPITIIGFGILTLGFGFLHNRAEFIALRCLLGIAESAVLPGNAAILARYYKRSEITTRVGTPPARRPRATLQTPRNHF